MFEYLVQGLGSGMQMGMKLGMESNQQQMSQALMKQQLEKGQFDIDKAKNEEAFNRAVIGLMNPATPTDKTNEPTISTGQGNVSYNPSPVSSPIKQMTEKVNQYAKIEELANKHGLPEKAMLYRTARMKETDHAMEIFTKMAALKGLKPLAVQGLIDLAVVNADDWGLSKEKIQSLNLDNKDVQKTLQTALAEIGDYKKALNDGTINKNQYDQLMTQLPGKYFPYLEKDELPLLTHQIDENRKLNEQDEKKTSPTDELRNYEVANGITADKRGTPEYRKGFMNYLKEKKQNITIQSMVPQNQVDILAKGILDGTINPDGISKRGGLQAAVWSKAKEIDPTFDLVKAGAGAKFQQGQATMQMKALLNAIDPLLTKLETAGGILGNSSIPLYNKAVNYLKEQTGSPDIVGFNNLRDDVIAEVERGLLNTGVLSDSKYMRALKNVNSAQTYPQLQAAVNNIRTVIRARLEALAQGPNAPAPGTAPSQPKVWKQVNGVWKQE